MVETPMKSLFSFAVAALATRRLVTLVTEDKITEDIRDAVLKRFPEDESKVGYLVGCRKCVSIWSGVATLCLLTLTKGAGQKVVYALALSETSIITDKLLDSVDTGFNL
jgi:hypothetical protein